MYFGDSKETVYIEEIPSGHYAFNLVADNCIVESMINETFVMESEDGKIEKI